MGVLVLGVAVVITEWVERQLRPQAAVNVPQRDVEPVERPVRPLFELELKYLSFRVPLREPPERAFRHYHYWEPLDPTKEYTKESFVRDFGRGERSYHWMGIAAGSRDNPRDFIVAREQISEEELKELQPYCSCEYCRTAAMPFPWWLQKRWICRCCVGCLGVLDPDIVNYAVLEKARKASQPQVKST